MRLLFVPPRLLHDWGDPETHRTAGWFELLYDLSFVAAAIKCSSALAKEISWEALGRYAVVFWHFWNAWASMTLYTTRFHANDLAHQLYYFLAMGATVLMTIHVVSFTSYGMVDVIPGFAVSAAVLYLVLTTMNAVVALYVARGRMMTSVYAVGHALSLIFCVVAPVPIQWGRHGEGEAAAMALLALGALSTTACTFGASFLPRRLPIHVEHIAERYGLFVMLVLGEAVISLILPELKRDAAHYGFVILGVTLVFGLMLVYFDGQPEEAAHHALRRSTTAGRTFTYSHIVLSGTLLLVGVALKVASKNVLAPLPDSKRWLLGGALCTSMILFSVIRMTHKGVLRELGLDAEEEPAPASPKAAARRKRMLRRMAGSFDVPPPTPTTAASPAAAPSSPSAPSATPSEGSAPRGMGALPPFSSHFTAASDSYMVPPPVSATVPVPPPGPPDSYVIPPRQVARDENGSQAGAPLPPHSLAPAPADAPSAMSLDADAYIIPPNSTSLPMPRPKTPPPPSSASHNEDDPVRRSRSLRDSRRRQNRKTRKPEAPAPAHGSGREDRVKEEPKRAGEGGTGQRENEEPPKPARRSSAFVSEELLSPTASVPSVQHPLPIRPHVIEGGPRTMSQPPAQDSQAALRRRTADDIRPGKRGSSTGNLDAARQRGKSVVEFLEPERSHRKRRRSHHALDQLPLQVALEVAEALGRRRRRRHSSQGGDQSDDDSRIHIRVHSSAADVLRESEAPTGPLRSHSTTGNALRERDSEEEEKGGIQEVDSEEEHDGDAAALSDEDLEVEVEAEELDTIPFYEPHHGTPTRRRSSASAGGRVDGGGHTADMPTAFGLDRIQEVESEGSYSSDEDEDWAETIATIATPGQQGRQTAIKVRVRRRRRHILPPIECRTRRRILWGMRFFLSFLPLAWAGVLSNALNELALCVVTVLAYVFADQFDVLNWEGGIVAGGKAGSLAASHAYPFGRSFAVRGRLAHQQPVPTQASNSAAPAAPKTIEMPRTISDLALERDQKIADPHHHTPSRPTALPPRQLPHAPDGYYVPGLPPAAGQHAPRVPSRLNPNR